MEALRSDRIDVIMMSSFLENWQDASNLWLALNPQTGQMNVAEVYADVPNPNGFYTPSSLLVSRALARQAQVSMRGR